MDAPENELITATLKALGGCDDAQNKCPLYCSFLISLLFGIFPSLRGGDFILVVAIRLTWENITNFVEENKITNMSEKQPQILIFNAAGEFMAIARSVPAQLQNLRKLMRTISKSVARIG